MKEHKDSLDEFNILCYNLNGGHNYLSKNEVEQDILTAKDIIKDEVNSGDLNTAEEFYECLRTASNFILFETMSDIVIRDIHNTYKNNIDLWYEDLTKDKRQWSNILVHLEEVSDNFINLPVSGNVQYC